MKTLSVVLFWVGIACIPLAWLVWYLGPGLELGRQVMADVADPAVRAALQEAHAERLGLWVAMWPVTLLVLSYILEKRA
ncbi:MAG: hypothetical protein ACE5NW_10915 [Acidiferrobacterales bacterium]